MERIIGRTKEIAELQQYIASPKAEFVAIYGRRRVGKTFLVDQQFFGQYAFRMTGVIDGTFADQILAFKDAMEDYGLPIETNPTNWMEAFIELKKALRPVVDRKERCIIFIDELPAMDTSGAKVANAVGYFWNNWAKMYDNITLIICGSATSWMIDNVIDSHGGLHDRITHEMHIHPFTLNETKKYLEEYHFMWNELMILQTYMVFGGVPYYLSLLNPNESLVQNIDRLFFSSDDQMRREYKRLFSTLYKKPQAYMQIVECLAASRYGLTREQIAERIGTTNNGHLGDKLDILCNSDLIQRIQVREKKIKRTECVYRLCDMFCLFYLTFLTRAQVELDYWMHHVNTPEINTWMGLSFESIVLNHIDAIKQALRIAGVSTLHYAWRSKTTTPAAQIDLVIERSDQIVNICEVKYCAEEYDLQKDEYDKLLHRCTAFHQETALRHTTWPTMISTFGLKNNCYSQLIPSHVKLKDLFTD